MKHPVGADDSFLPSFLAEEAVLDQQIDRLSDDLVEELDSDLDGILIFITENDDLVADGVLADGGEPMAHTAFGGVDTILEAEAEGEIGVARMSKVTQRFSPVPAVGDLPAEEQEDGDGIERVPTAGGGPAQPLSQDGTQRTEID